jgi:hypothetical protein
MPARTFKVSRPGSECVDCGQELELGTTAVMLGKGKYAHNDPCTPDQIAKAAGGAKVFWDANEAQPQPSKPSYMIAATPKQDTKVALLQLLLAAKAEGYNEVEITTLVHQVYGADQVSFQ